MKDETGTPDGTAVRVALWRAMHVQVDPSPHVIEDRIGFDLAAPDQARMRRPDMDPRATSRFRAAIVARARFVEDLVVEEAGRGVDQYVILGAGLDSFVQRRPEFNAGLTIFEVDRPSPQLWKRRRLGELGFPAPDWLRFAPCDFEAGGLWRESLAEVGFDAGRPAVVASTGVSMYLTHEAVTATLREAAALATSSTLVMSFMLPLDLIDVEERPGREASERGAHASGTPFISLFAPEEMVALARETGFRNARCVSGADLAERYFAGRADGLRPGASEALLVATNRVD